MVSCDSAGYELVRRGSWTGKSLDTGVYQRLRMREWAWAGRRDERFETDPRADVLYEDTLGILSSLMHTDSSHNKHDSPDSKQEAVPRVV